MFRILRFDSQLRNNHSETMIWLFRDRQGEIADPFEALPRELWDIKPCTFCPLGVMLDGYSSHNISLLRDLVSFIYFLIIAVFVEISYGN